MTRRVDWMKNDRKEMLTELLAGARRLHRRNRRIRHVLAFSTRVAGPALKTAALLSLARTLGPRRTGRLLVVVAGSELARSRRGSS
jgi:hypothetical protein